MKNNNIQIKNDKRQVSKITRDCLESEYLKHKNIASCFPIMKKNNIQVKKFNIETDLKNLEDYLRSEYLEHKNMTSWLPQRLHEVIYKMNEFEVENGYSKSMDYICLFVKKEEIVGCIFPDANVLFTSLKRGYEDLYEEMIRFAQEYCKPLCKVNNRLFDLHITESDSYEYKKEILRKLNYERIQGASFDCYVYPQQVEVEIKLPNGFKLCYGDDYKDEQKKWTALNMALCPTIDYSGFEYKTNTYNARKQSSMYKDSFECLVIDENSNEDNNIASYCFVYVDKETKSALIEPVGTRRKYQHKGIGTAMMHGVILKCKELGIEKCHVYCVYTIKRFYENAGFIVDDIKGIWKRRV